MSKALIRSPDISPLDGASPFPENYYQAMINDMDVALLVVDTQGCTTLANKAARESFGISRGINLNQVLPELWAKIDRKLKGRTRSVRISVRDTEKNYLVRVSPVTVERKRVGAVCVFVESTELEDMARQMRFFQELTRELDTIIDSSSDGLWICDADANVIRINPASERINNVRAEDVVGRNMHDLVNLRVFDRSATLEVLRTSSVINMLQQREGRKLIMTGTPVFDEDGKIIRVVVSERDVTEIDTMQRRLEEQEALKDQFRHQMIEMQQEQTGFHEVIARSPCMVKALRQALKVSKVESTVLLLGESGVGKGLFADLIHKNSRRAEKPLIKINCGAIPESLIESELFGYEKGAFTGAQANGKPGYLELTDGGILFLDEIAELPLASQVKLLRFLEDSRITRVGATKSRTVDVRILAATHRNLEEMVTKGTFRLDLFYRLKVIPIQIPALRERKECILPLINHYITLFAEKNSGKTRLSRAALDALLAYSYPGNVRELINICERLVVMSDTEIIDFQDLPGDIAGQVEDLQGLQENWPEGMSLQLVLDRAEKALLLQTLKRCGNQTKMAEVLGVNQSTIARKLKKHGLG